MQEGDRQPFAIMTNKGEVVTKSVYDRYVIKEKGEVQSRQIKDPFQDTYRINNLLQPLYNPTMLSHLLEINTWHKRCVKTKAQDIAGLGWEIKPSKMQKQEEGADPKPSENQRRIAHKFFEEQWPPLLITLKRAEIDYDSTGNAYLELVREANAAESPYAIIAHVPAHTIRVHRDGNRYAQIRGVKKVWFKKVEFDKDVDCQTGEIYELGSLPPDRRASELIHRYEYTPRSDFQGVPDIISSLGAIQGDLSQRDYNIKFFENFGIPAYAIYTTGDYDLGEKDPDTGEYELIKTIKGFMDQVQKEPHSSLIFGVPSIGEGKVEVEFKSLAIETKDASFRMYRKDNRDEIIANHGVPSYRIGMTETGSLGGSTAKESTEIYIDSVINPRQEDLEANINKFILRDNLEVNDWDFKLKSLSLDDEKHDKEILAFLFDNGGATPNDLIRHFGSRFGIEPDPKNPALEKHYLKGQPIEDVGGEVPEGEDIEVALMSLQNKLLEIAMKAKRTG